jgi:hypothetical protein
MSWWRSFRHKLHTARLLALADWLILAEAWWALFGFYLALRWVSYDRLEAFTSLATNKSTPVPDVLARARQRLGLVSLAAHFHLLPMTCLPRALTLRWLLSRDGIPAELRIGVNKTPAGMYSHAWVELDGQPIGEPQDIPDRFKILQSAA